MSQGELIPLVRGGPLFYFRGWWVANFDLWPSKDGITSHSMLQLQRRAQPAAAIFFWFFFFVKGWIYNIQTQKNRKIINKSVWKSSQWFFWFSRIGFPNSESTDERKLFTIKTVCLYTVIESANEKNKIIHGQMFFLLVCKVNICLVTDADVLFY